jgi:hypothetical protein
MVWANNKRLATQDGTSSPRVYSRQQRKLAGPMSQARFEQDSTYLEQEIIVCTFGHLVCLTWLELKYSRRIDSAVTLS